MTPGQHQGWICHSRDGGTYNSDHYPLRQDDRPEDIANLVMSDLKATFGRGR
ncbi:hypothetical protein [Kitasatospora sp. CB01950]|uniref:hypothetical protein n=1 Tax=Kitasatospora sp. CB01950 TaxID=1703930 RepID=UPI001300D398|nr:hypothetical protein [Kitasatospora sp. CB01950]